MANRRSFLRSLTGGLGAVLTAPLARRTAKATVAHGKPGPKHLTLRHSPVLGVTGNIEHNANTLEEVLLTRDDKAGCYIGVGDHGPVFYQSYNAGSGWESIMGRTSRTPHRCDYDCDLH